MLGKYELNKIYNEDSYKAIKDIPDMAIRAVEGTPQKGLTELITGEEPKAHDPIPHIKELMAKEAIWLAYLDDQSAKDPDGYAHGTGPGRVVSRY